MLAYRFAPPIGVDPLVRTVAIIQARMGSTRLPGKVLMPLAGRPVISRVIDRVRSAGVFDAVVVATTTGTLDDGLAATAAASGALVVRGDEVDVLGRFQQAAIASEADAIMRITADCPLIDPTVLAELLNVLRRADGAVDLVSNARRRTFPRGLDAELFTRAALDLMAAEAHASHQREHVTPFLYENPERFEIVDVLHDTDLSALRWTLDTPEDLELLEHIFDSAERPDELRLDDVLTLLAEHPDWTNINAHIEQKRI